MLFDDRLATVLRHRATGERAARTQFMQLLDLLGRAQRGSDDSLRAAAWLRLAALGESIPARQRAAMIRSPGLRFHSPELAVHFAEDEPEVAAAALSSAQLREEDWEVLIPRLPVRARGFLRLRDDLPPGAMRLLDRLGVRDRGLPLPSADRSAPARQETLLPVSGTTPAPVAANDGGPATPDLQPTPGDGAEPGRQPSVAIGTLVRRIEAFQRERSQRDIAGTSRDAPRLPLGEDEENAVPPLIGFAFTLDAAGRVDWAEPHVAPSLMYTAVPPLLGPPGRRAFESRQPLVRENVVLEGAAFLSGEWLCDAAPRFTSGEGQFYGYAGRMRRAPAEASGEAEDDSGRTSDAVRQLLHELRTPVNAIQGFAELIQQQLFGPVPHEYRALAAGIAGDSARMLAGFDELDRFARLQSGALEIETGAADHSAILAAVARRLDEGLAARDSGFPVTAAESLWTALSPATLETLLWRVLASLAGSLAPGEKASISLVGDRKSVRTEIALPSSLACTEDVFQATARKGGGAASASAFGPGYALRLAKVEARAAGGDLARVDDRLVLILPRLTGVAAEPSEKGTGVDGRDRSAGVP